MFWLKACPRCQGDLFESADLQGTFLECLQCGYYLTDAEEAAFKYMAERFEKAVVDVAEEKVAVG